MLAKIFVSIASVTMVSRVLGYIRDLVTAFFLGAGVLNDIFIVALRIPNLFRTVFAEGAMNVVFVPILNKITQNSGNQEAKFFISNIKTIIILTLLIIWIISMIYMDTLVLMIAPGYKENAYAYELAVTLSRLSFIYVIFISVVALYGGVGTTIGSYIPFASASIIMNIILILFAFFGKTDVEKLYFLTIAVPIAGFVEMLWMFYFIWKKIGFIGLCMPKMTKETVILFKKMLPGIGSAGIIQFNVFFTTMLASFSSGGISYLYYADRIYQLPLGVIAVSLSSLMLNELSKAVAVNNMDVFRKINAKAIITILFFTIPALIGLHLESYSIVELLFQRGEFTASDTEKTARALMIFAFGVPFYSLYKVLSTAFFAAGNIMLPTIVSLFALFINVITSYILLQHFDYLAIAYGSVISFIFSNISLFLLLYRRKMIYFDKNNYFVILIIILMNIMLGLMIYLLKFYILNFYIRLMIYLFITILCAIPLLRISTIFKI